MARLLSGVGLVLYNGFVFPAPFEAEVTATPRRDSSGRVIKYISYSITIKTTIVPDDAPKSTPGGLVDDNIENIRCRLLKPGGSLVFIGQGFGTDFVINNTAAYLDPDTGNPVSSFKLDKTFGPFPTLLTWKPSGSNRACYIVWGVEVTIPDCCQTETSNYNVLSEFNYTISYDVNREGATTRIIQGRYEVPGLRAAASSGITGGGGSGSRIAVSADSYWQTVFNSFLQPQGFMRDHRHALTADKRYCDFTITDTEIASDNAYFPYMVRMDVRHRASQSATGLVAGKINNSLSGTITTAPGAPRHLAWLAASRIIQQRVFASAGLQYQSFGQGSTPVTRTSYPVPIHASIEENLYGRDVSFQFDWFYIGNIQAIFQGSNLFRPVSYSGAPESTSPAWASWTASMLQLAYSPRGLAEMSHVPADDLLITACDPQPVTTKNASAIKYLAENPLITATNVDPPPAPSSYIHFSMETSPVEDYNFVVHRRTKNVSQNLPHPASVGDPLSTDARIDVYNTENTSEIQHTTHVRGPSHYSCVISGEAIRWAYPIQPPQVTSLGGATPNIKLVKWAQKIIGKIAGYPVYGASWATHLDFNTILTGDLMRSTAQTNGFPEYHL